MLVVALGLVFAAMRHLRQPETVENLDELLHGQVAATAEQTNEPVIRSTLETHPDVFDMNTRVVPIDSNGYDDEFSHITDNTYFRPEESEAWFTLFERLQAMETSPLEGEQASKATYAQLLQQPNVYRGKLVSIRGTVLREEEQVPMENDVGISRYHRLWLQPEGGGQWPIVVYSLLLPADFPRGDSLRAEISLAGFFFKNWSYSYDDGLGIAPIVLARDIVWNAPEIVAPRQTVTIQNLIWPATGAALLALTIVWWAVRRTVRRPRRYNLLPDTFLASAEPLAEENSGGPV